MVSSTPGTKYALCFGNIKMILVASRQIDPGYHIAFEHVLHSQRQS